MIPIISIISPIYNSEKYLDQMILSVKNQTFTNWELILIDDKSTDNTWKKIKKYESSKIKIIKNKKNFGAGISRNIGTKLSRGRYITFLDSDDYWDKNFLKKTLNFIKKNNYDFVFTSYYWTDEKGSNMGIFNVPKRINYKEILKSNPISCLTRMYDTKKLGKVFSPSLKIRQDYIFCLNILKKIDFAYGLDYPLAFRRLRPKSLSYNKFISAKYQFFVYYNYEKFNIVKSFYYLFRWFIAGIMKHFRNYGL